MGIEFPDGGCIRNKITFSLLGEKLTLIQNEDFIKAYPRPTYKGKLLSVTKVIVENVEESKINHYLEKINDLSDLLSFTTESQVRYQGHDYPKEGSIKRRSSTTGTIETWRPPFEIEYPAELVKFINSCYDNYVQLRDSRQLPIVFDYIYYSLRKETAVEIKLAMLFILLENLKHTYALQTGYKYKDANGKSHPSPTNNNDTLNFKRLLNEMLEKVGMTEDLNDIKNFRNDLIHEGLINRENNLFKLYEKIMNIVREYIFRLLDFKGTFNCYTPGEQITLP